MLLSNLAFRAIRAIRASRVVPCRACRAVFCSTQGLVCKETFFTLLNSCTLLKENFPCTECSESYGFDQPCYVELGAPATNVRDDLISGKGEKVSEEQEPNSRVVSGVMLLECVFLRRIVFCHVRDPGLFWDIRELHRVRFTYGVCIFLVFVCV